MNVPVTIEVDYSEYRELKRVAISRGETTAAVIKEIVANAMKPSPPNTGLASKQGVRLRSEQVAEIASLNRLGMNDKQIGDRMNLRYQTVAKHRRAMKLPARIRTREAK